MNSGRIDKELADLQSRGIVNLPEIDLSDSPAAKPPPFTGGAGMGGLGSPMLADAARATAGTPAAEQPAVPPPGAPVAQQAPPEPFGPPEAPAPPAQSVAVNEENPEVASAQAEAARRALAAQAPQLQQPQFVPPHFDDRNVPIKPETRKAILGTFDDVAQAQQLEARAKVDQAAVTAEQMGAEAQRARHSLAMQMQAEDNRRQEMRAQLQKLNDVTEAARGGRINPNEVWEQKGTFGRLSASIGIILGAGVQTQTGHNPALEILNGEIARNLDAQKANLAAANNDVLKQDNLLGKYREMFGDEKLAELAFENTAREVAMQQIQAEAAKRQVPVIQANAQQAIAVLKQQQLEAQARFEQMAFVRGQLVGGAPAAKKIEQDANIVRLPDGRVVRFPSEKEAIEARAKLTAAYNTVDMYDQAKRLRKRLADINPLTSPLEYSNAENELDSLAERILPEWSLSHGQGQVKEEEARRYKENLFPFSQNTLFNTERADRVLDQGREKELSQIENLVRGSAGEFVGTGYATDKNGRTVQDVELEAKPATGKKIAKPSGFKPFGAR